MKAKAIAYCIVFLFAYTSLLAQQNIVLNGDFEEFLDCPDYDTDFSNCDNWTSAYGACRYLNSCNVTGYGVPVNNYGFSHAQSGNAYISLTVLCDSTYYALNPPGEDRDWAKGRLRYELLSGHDYIFTMYVKKSIRLTAASNRIGSYFSAQEININQPPWPEVPYSLIDTSKVIYEDSTICDTTDWHIIKGVYTASGGEKYIYIGNFFPDSLCKIAYCYNSNEWDRWNHLAFYFIDNVSLIDKDSLTSLPEISVPAISIYPNPTSGDLYIVNPQDNTLQVEIVSPLGQTVDKQTIVPGSNYLNVAILPNGIYLLRIIGQGQSMSQRLVIAQ